MPRPYDDGGGSSASTNAPKTVTLSNNGRGIQSGLDLYINPPPDSRLNDIVSRKAPGLRHGLIQQTDDWAKSNPGGKPYGCRFLFNPSVISVSYGVAEGVTPPGELTADQAKGTAVYPGSTSIAFSLLFDRTYDVYYGPQAKGGVDLRDVGCYADIGALEQVTGVRTLNSGVLQGMVNIPVYVIFGGGNGGKNGKPLTGLTFTGYIQSMSVQYGLFSENMVPTRASVDIGMTQIVGADPLAFNAAGGTLVDRGAAKFPTVNRDTRSKTGTNTTKPKPKRR